jgi:septation ring formation regulator EzrA
MPQMMLDIRVKDIKSMIFQLPVHDFMRLVEELEERAETIAMMGLAETGFEEWNEEGEDIYDVEA